MSCTPAFSMGKVGYKLGTRQYQATMAIILAGTQPYKCLSFNHHVIVHWTFSCENPTRKFPHTVLQTFAQKSSLQKISSGQTLPGRVIFVIYYRRLPERVPALLTSIQSLGTIQSIIQTDLVHWNAGTDCWVWILRVVVPLCYNICVVMSCIGE